MAGESNIMKLPAKSMPT